MKFTKMQGAGNDYVYVDCFREKVNNPSELAVLLSDRHFGIGSDGLILIRPSDDADCEMEMYNADGSRGAMCGNGIRCVGKYVYDHGIVDKTRIRVKTGSGIKTLDLHVEGGKVTSATVDMGTPEQTSEIGEPITVGGREYHFTGISMGNPHAVLFMDEIADLDLPEIGPKFEHHSRFPDRTNTEFIKVIDRTHIDMRVWERGSGETMACGTGACAAAVASVLNGYTENDVSVKLLGGTLVIRWDRDKNTVFMTGPAVEVFSGTIDTDNFS
jgi:diaminopimelate epimerase